VGRRVADVHVAVLAIFRPPVGAVRAVARKICMGKGLAARLGDEVSDRLPASKPWRARLSSGARQQSGQ
jgi:hypothetical protein